VSGNLSKIPCILKKNRRKCTQSEIHNEKINHGDIVNNALLVFFGCGIGGLLRYYTSRLICSFIDSPFPYSTLFINISGSFIMGLLFTWLLRHNSNLTQSLGPFLLIGLLGGYTTFSAFSVETLGLIHSGKLFQALLYALVSVLLCVGGASLGMAIAKA